MLKQNKKKKRGTIACYITLDEILEVRRRRDSCGRNSTSEETLNLAKKNRTLILFPNIFSTSMKFLSPFNND